MSISGTVVHGKGKGRTIGYPTANIEYTVVHPPVAGVWVALAHVGFVVHEAVVVVGMWTGTNGMPSVEVHFLDAREECYGKLVTVSFLEKLRELATFAAQEELVVQIEKDILEAKKLLRARTL